MADKFELAYEWVALKEVEGSAFNGDLNVIVPVDGESFEIAWKSASKLAEEGWELVSSVPITAGAFPPTGKAIAFSYTCAFVLLFKRRID